MAPPDRKRGGGRRPPSVRVRTARRRRASSTAWLRRQLNDPYVAEARRRGFRSRAAFKLIELDDKLRLLKPGLRVIDLGAAPGGWTQVAVARTRAAEGQGQVIAVDREAMDPVAGATVLVGDFMASKTQAAVRAALGGPADLVLSDLSPPTTGHKATDHLRIVALVEETVAFAESVLAPGGALVAKVFQGGAAGDLLERVKARFDKVRHVKPAASRKESPEVYLVATGFRGVPGADQP
jgi:23S rRNA (uridine2552-2'-O)-methyltransferase